MQSGARPSLYGRPAQQPACERATRLARLLFEGADAGVECGPLFADQRVQACLDDDAPVWRTDPQGFFAAAPIRTHDAGSGVLWVSAGAGADFSPRLAQGLHDLAQSVAWEWERTFAAERLALSEERLRIIIDEAELNVYELDFVTHELWKGGFWESMFQEPLTYEALREDIWTTVAPEDRPLAIAAWEHSQRTGQPFRVEYRLNRTDGREVWVASTAKLISDANGRPLRLVGALQDITARKAAEAARANAEAASVAKSAFLANMSHEIRTPLNGVLGMVQAMANDVLEPRQGERLDVIRQSGEALLTILNDILDLSKIEAGKFELQQIDFELAKLAASVDAAFRPVAEAKGLEIELDLSNASGVYCGDPDRLRQILNNLVSNAVKFTEGGTVRIGLWGDGDLVRLVVSDTGIGIAPEVVGKLFTSFTQADVGTTRRFGGTGLGLSICRELAELMGGAIEVDSAVGQGSVFTVTLPIPRVADAGIAAEPAEPAVSSGAPRPDRALRVLAAEDNPINRLVLQTLLQQVGIEPVLVEDGDGALRAWEAEEFDLILMDVQMPGVDGPTATRRIRRREAATGRSRTPIIAITANVMARQMAEYVAGGMDCCVAKPISAERLFEAMDAVLSGEDEAAPAVAAG